jgi:hypothetical protein
MVRRGLGSVPRVCRAGRFPLRIGCQIGGRTSVFTVPGEGAIIHRFPVCVPGGAVVRLRLSARAMVCPGKGKREGKQKEREDSFTKTVPPARATQRSTHQLTRAGQRHPPMAGSMGGFPGWGGPDCAASPPRQLHVFEPCAPRHPAEAGNRRQAARGEEWAPPAPAPTATKWASGAGVGP